MTTLNTFLRVLLGLVVNNFEVSPYNYAQLHGMSLSTERLPFLSIIKTASLLIIQTNFAGSAMPNRTAHCCAPTQKTLVEEVADAAALQSQHSASHSPA